MSFLTGRTREVDLSPRETRGTRRDIASFINGQGIDQIFMGAGGPQQEQFMESILAPYRAMFEQQRAESFGQAREMSGNLTGSGYGNIMARAAGNAATAEGAQLADIRQRITAQNAQNFLNLVMGFQNSGMPLQQQYQPGFLDYAMQGVSAAAPFLGPMFAGRPPVPGMGGGTQVVNLPNGGIP